MRRPNANWVLVVGPGLFIAMLGGVVLCVEALRLGPFATPSLVATYHFGSESMVGVGGWPYLSQSNYIKSSALEGAGLLLSGAVLMVALLRRRALWLVFGYSGLALVLTAIYWPMM